MPKPQNTKPRATPARATPPPQSMPPKAEQLPVALGLIELRPGLYLNPVQFISVRALPRDDGDVFAVLALSNGEKLNLSRSEFAAITGVELGRSAVGASQEIKGAVKLARPSAKAAKTQSQ